MGRWSLTKWLPWESALNLRKIVAWPAPQTIDPAFHNRIQAPLNSFSVDYYFTWTIQNQAFKVSFAILATWLPIMVNCYFMTGFMKQSSLPSSGFPEVMYPVLGHPIQALSCPWFIGVLKMNKIRIEFYHIFLITQHLYVTQQYCT